jgi:hypothetical protein
MFSEYKNKNLGSVLLPDKTEMAIAGTGFIDISTEMREVKLKDVLYVPGLRNNLFSVSQAISTRHDVKFQICGNTCYLRNIKSGKVNLKGKLKDGLYILEAKSSDQERGLSSKKAQLLNSEVVLDWHSRLGHVNPQTVAELIREGRIQCPVMKNGQDKNEVCPSCAKGKMTRKPSRSEGSELLQH